MPCCCARCGAALDARTQQQVKMLQRLADLGMGLAEAVAAFPLRTQNVDYNTTQNFELFSRGMRRCLALEAKLTADARQRHDREVHGAPARTLASAPGSAPRPQDALGERPRPPLPLVTTEDVESVIGPEPVVRETAERLLDDGYERLLDRFVEDRTPAVVAAAICRDLNAEEDLSVFLEPVPTRDDPWVQAETAAVEAQLAHAMTASESSTPASEDVGSMLPRLAETGAPPDRPPPVAKGRYPP